MDASIKSSTLSNGIEVVLVKRRYSQVAAANIYFRAGSRYDPCDDGLSGLAHLTEHLLFKPNKEVFSAIESRGGRIDAGTSREYAFLSTVTLPQELFPALDILARIILDSEFTPADIESEKLIISEEISRRQDKEEMLLDILLGKLFENHSLGNPVLGTLPGVRSATRENLTTFYRKHFTGNNMAIAVCGDFDQADALEYLEKKFAGLPQGRKISRSEEHNSSVREDIHRDMYLNQAHIVMGFPAPDMKSTDRYPFKLIDIILGTGADSLLYKELRVNQTLVYSVRSIYLNYEDAGCFVIKTSCSPHNVQRVVESVHSQIEGMRDAIITPDVVSNAKKQYEGRLYRSFETNHSIASICGLEALLSRVEPFEESTALVNSVTEEGLSATLEKWLNRGRCIVLTVGRPL